MREKEGQMCILWSSTIVVSSQLVAEGVYWRITSIDYSMTVHCADIKN